MNQHWHLTLTDNRSQILPAPPIEFMADSLAGWQTARLTSAGVNVFLFEIEPRAVEYPMHAAHDAWLGYVATGSGTIFAGTANAKESEAAFYAGDFITFDPLTPHGWQNGPESTRILFFKPA